MAYRSLWKSWQASAPATIRRLLKPSNHVTQFHAWLKQQSSAARWNWSCLLCIWSSWIYGVARLPIRVVWFPGHESG